MTQEPAVEVTDNLIYAVHDGKELRAVLYRPKAPGPHPVIVSIGGGGFMRSSRLDHTQWGHYLAQRGYAVASIEYRVGKGSFPGAVFDAIAAVKYVRGMADEFGLDAKRIGILGTSAGANLAAMAALAWKHPFFQNGYPEDRFASVNPAVSTLIAVYGVYDMAAAYRSILSSNSPGGFPYLGKDLYEDRDLYNLASPSHHVTYESVKGLTVFLPYGMLDDMVPPALHSEPFLETLKQARCMALSCPIPFAGHLWFHLDPIDEPGSASAFLAPRLVRFLELTQLAVKPFLADTSRPRTN